MHAHSKCVHTCNKQNKCTKFAKASKKKNHIAVINVHNIVPRDNYTSLLEYLSLIKNMSTWTSNQQILFTELDWEKHFPATWHKTQCTIPFKCWESFMFSQKLSHPKWNKNTCFSRSRIKCTVFFKDFVTTLFSYKC